MVARTAGVLGPDIRVGGGRPVIESRLWRKHLTGWHSSAATPEVGVATGATPFTGGRESEGRTGDPGGSAW
jgi:hypothetical protein